MTTLRYTWYAIALLFFPIWLTLFWIHRIFIFVTKPGAALIVPIVLVGTAIAMRTYIDALFGEAITNWFYFDFLGPEEVKTPGSLAALAFEFRMEIVFLWVFAAAGLLITVSGRILQPIMAAFPAPRPPLKPNAPLIVKDHKIETVVARVAVSKRGSSFNGKLPSLVSSLPPEARSVITASQAASQASVTEAKAAEADARRTAKQKAKADAAGARAQAMLEAKQSEQARQDAKRRAKDDAARRQQERERASEAKRQAKIDQALEKRHRKARRAYEKAALKAAKRGEPLPDPPASPLVPDAPKTANQTANESGSRLQPVQPDRAGAKMPPPQSVRSSPDQAATRPPSRQEGQPRPSSRPQQVGRPAASAGPSPPRQFGSGAPRPGPPMRPPPQGGGNVQAPGRRMPEPDR